MKEWKKTNCADVNDYVATFKLFLADDAVMQFSTTVGYLAKQSIVDFN